MIIDSRSYMCGYIVGAAVAIGGMIVADLIYESGKRDGKRIQGKVLDDMCEEVKDLFDRELDKACIDAYNRGFTAGKDEGEKTGYLKGLHGGEEDE